MKGLTILGSTGSIGVSTLDVIAHHPDRYSVVALTADKDVEAIYQQCRRFHPAFAVMADPKCATELTHQLKDENPRIRVLAGIEGLQQVAALPEVDYVMAAIVGAAGLLPALAAVRHGKRLLLANKEALVISGRLFMDEVERHKAEILPIDSEHNAVFQCMPPGFGRGLHAVGVRKILLTASGGPFRQTPLGQLAAVTPDQACNHPNWEMGRKISVDSATMMNKGLEVIEACWLFGARPDQIEVILHPQSIIHSMVEYTDGSVLAQLGNPDMRTPIAHALAWPERIASGVSSLDLIGIEQLQFEPPDMERFRCLRLAYQAIEIGGAAPAVLNAANEVAVAAFLNHEMSFTAIPPVIEETLETSLSSRSAPDLETLLGLDLEARAQAEQIIRQQV